MNTLFHEAATLYTTLLNIELNIENGRVMASVQHLGRIRHLRVRAYERWQRRRGINDELASRAGRELQETEKN